ncbi:MAG: hypothetical protein KF757_10075 [Phycisphaeraceae bacterium]|nr:hypothetical protein [Phycisphaeraceae bacterium]MCW5763560.1 hypothetical protein [Phycisphaeraceae bacterium]
MMLFGGLASCEGENPSRLEEMLSVPSRSESGTVEVLTIEAHGHQFEAVVHTPSPSRNTGWAVLMIGGGLGNTLDWDVPGSLIHNGESMQLTISGEPHADAPLLRAALVSEGLTVLHWSTIAHGDPLADQWPTMATARTQAELLEQARAALGMLRARPGVRVDRVLLLGHSQGAMRAWSLASEDRSVAGLILLAPAYFSRDERVAGSLAKQGLSFGEDVVRVCGIRTLAIFGALDKSSAVNADAALMLMNSPGFEKLSVHVLPRLGHQLGPQVGDLSGPIDASVIRTVTEWSLQFVNTP